MERDKGYGFYRGPLYNTLVYKTHFNETKETVSVNMLSFKFKGNTKSNHQMQIIVYFDKEQCAMASIGGVF